MKKASPRSIVSILLLVAAAAAILLAQSPLPAGVGEGDFRPYWSSSYLLARGQDFSDGRNMDRVERELTGWSKDFTMFAWFSPAGNLVLLPFTLLPFRRAAYYWLLVNIVVVFASAYLLWRGVGKAAWVPLAAAFAWSMTLVSLVFGQMNTLEVLGLAVFLFLLETQRQGAAGAALALTTIKPHLVILTLPLLLLDAVRRRQWKLMAGFAGALIAGGLVLFAFHPAWPLSFWKVVASGMDSVRLTPTLSGVLALAGQPALGKGLWLAGLLAAALAWLRWGRDWDRRTLIDVSVMLGLILSPIGWSYDQIMLLLPILTLLGWVVAGRLRRGDAILVVAALILIDALSYYQRVVTTSDVWFFWIPPAILAIYVYAWLRRLE